MPRNSKETNLVRAAELYYEQQMSQLDIAKEMHCSRSTVSRLLAEALDTGIVRIHIKRPVHKFPSLAKDIKKEFKLKEVVVVSGGNSTEQAFHNVGFASAELLSKKLHDDIVIGISWGVTLSYLVKELSEFSFNYQGVEVIQLMGGLGSGDPAIDGPELAQRMARVIGANYRYIQAPAVVESPQTAEIMMKEKHIHDTLQKASLAEITISSIGSLMDNLSSMERSGYIKKEERAEYLIMGAVGHSMARLINEKGEEIDHVFNQRVIGAPLQVMRDAKYSFGIGANPLKAQAFLAAIIGKHFNVLVIDDGTAREILRLR